MVFMEQRLQEPQQLAQWWKQIIRVKPEPGSPGSEGKVQPENEQRDNGWDVPTEMRQWRVFEFADILEQGLGPGLTTSFVEPPGAKEAKERRLIVDIEPDRSLRQNCYLTSFENFPAAQLQKVAQMTPASCSSSLAPTRLLSLLLIISFTGLPAFVLDFLLDEESNDDVNDMLEEVKVILNKPAAETKVGKEALDCNTMELPESFMSVVFSLGWCALLPEIMAFAAALAGFGTLRSLLARPEGPTKAAEEELEQEEAAENWSLYEEDEMNESVMRLSQRETTDVFGCTALHMAAHSGSAERVQELLAKGFSPNAREAWDETPLHMAARAGNVQACSSLVKAGATLDAMNADDKTPLMVAAQAKQEGVCELLLDLGAGCGGAADEALPPLLSALLLQRLLFAQKPAAQLSEGAEPEEQEDIPVWNDWNEDAVVPAYSDTSPRVQAKRAEDGGKDGAQQTGHATLLTCKLLGLAHLILFIDVLFPILRCSERTKQLLSKEIAVRFSNRAKPLVKREYLLSTESGEALLMAATCADGLGFEMFITCGGEPPKALGPAFSLRCNAQRDQWSLCSVRCEKCETLGKRQLGTRELARVNHYCETVGDGNAFCMDVEMPEILEDGSCSVICPVCAGPDADVGGQVLSSRRPKWNARQKTLTLDFRGRCSMASAKNFQLEAENDASKCTLLFGKIASNKFVLDFKHPFGMVQAFAAALTATHWK
ncbi:unnamed protein product [Polarella glacialis]|uniref:Tubby C-terminal domain-containing protein n=2 Tax=Polarella glacialis TaxID=89957 RepID=A0A813EBE9_POLGL|nr:unnamed protein product [Polarella glacialis]